MGAFSGHCETSQRFVWSSSVDSRAHPSHDTWLRWPGYWPVAGAGRRIGCRGSRWRTRQVDPDAQISLICTNMPQLQNAAKMSHELYGCLALTGPGGANVRVSRHWHSAQELTELTVMDKLVYLGIVRGQAQLRNMHITRNEYNHTYSHMGQNSVAMLQYGVGDLKGKC